MQAAYQFIMDELSPNSARFILYPYAFSATNGSATFGDGAVISTTADGLGQGALFNSFANDASIYPELNIDNILMQT